MIFFNPILIAISFSCARFTIAAVINGKIVAEGKAFNKKDASQIAAQAAVEKLGIEHAGSLGNGEW